MSNQHSTSDVNHIKITSQNKTKKKSKMDNSKECLFQPKRFTSPNRGHTELSYLHSYDREAILVFQ